MYICLIIFFLVGYHNSVPSINHLFLQSLTVFVFTYLCLYSLRKRIKTTNFFLVIAFCILFEILVFRSWNIIIYNNPLGYNPIDASAYDKFARTFCENKYQIWDVLNYVSSSDESFDDYGFNSIICIVYKIFGVDTGIWALAILNTIAITLGCYYLFKLSKLFKIYKEGNIYIALLLATFSYGIFTAATGLKENFFCCIVIITMFRLYKYNKKNNMSNLILFSLGVLGCSLFRLAILFIFFATFIFLIALKFKIFKNHLIFWILLGIGLSFFLLTLVINYISELRGSMAVNQGYVDAIASGSNIFIYSAINLISVLSGPIPNFICDLEKQNYITLWNFGSFVRLLLSGYLLFGMYQIIKNKLEIFYPLMFFIVMHSIMLVVTMFAIHDRYQIIQLPFVYIICVFGMIRLRYTNKKVKLFYNNIYILGASLFVMLFNIFKN